MYIPHYNSVNITVVLNKHYPILSNLPTVVIRCIFSDLCNYSMCLKKEFIIKPRK